MGDSANMLRWDGSPGHYEVYYVSATDPDSGVGLWIRYTMLAPERSDTEPTAALWLMAMDPRGPGPLPARKITLAASSPHASADPFSLRIGDAVLDDHGMSGAFEDARWDLRWEPGRAVHEHVHPLLRRARIAKTVLVLPHGDLEITGTVSVAGRELSLAPARGGQAHLWGAKHANRWAWVHSNDLRRPEEGPVADAFVDAVSVFVTNTPSESPCPRCPC